MNKALRDSFLVGLMGLIVIGILYGSYAWLSGTLLQARTDTYYVSFQDAQGVAPGSEVRLAGVTIGRVDSVGLDQRTNNALLKLQIEEKFDVPSGSKFAVQGRLLGGTPTLSIEPPRPSKGGTLPPNTADNPYPGEAAGGLLSGALTSDQNKQVDQLITATTQLAQNLGDLTTALNDPKVRKELQMADQTLRNIRVLTANAAEATQALPRLTGQMESQLSTLSLQANQVLANLQTASASGNRIAQNAEGLSSDLRATLNENRPALRSLVQSADEAASSIAGLTNQLADTVANPQIRDNLVATSNNLASISQRMEAAASDLQRLSSDPRLSADIRETVSNVREASGSLRNLASRIETIRIPGERRRPAPGEVPPAPPAPRPPASATLLLQPGLALDSSYDTTLERLRVDANYTLLTGKEGTFYRIGLYDATEANRFNLQVGQADGVPAGFAYRYGLFAGKLGVGLDARTGPLYWSLDAFDPNRFQLNARARTYLNENAAITVGVDSLGKDDRAVLGVQIRK